MIFPCFTKFQVDASTLDCAAQRSRIFVKNPRVRPPKDPRTLLNMPSLEPTPPPQHRVPAGLPMGGLGIGIKLPGGSFATDGIPSPFHDSMKS